MLILLIGPPGSGKDFLLPHIEESCEANPVSLSADRLRKIIGGYEGNQEVNGAVFATLRRMTEYLLEDGFDVIINNTNYNKKNRKDFIEIARRLNKPVKAIYIKSSLETCKRRNLERARIVPESVIEKQFTFLDIPDTTEVDEIEVINND